jgi:hypothetical protein
MRRKLLVVLLAAMMAVMTIVGASPAFAQGTYWTYVWDPATETWVWSEEPMGSYCFITPYEQAPC